MHPMWGVMSSTCYNWESEWAPHFFYVGWDLSKCWVVYCTCSHSLFSLSYSLESCSLALQYFALCSYRSKIFPLYMFMYITPPLFSVSLPISSVQVVIVNSYYCTCWVSFDINCCILKLIAWCISFSETFLCCVMFHWNGWILQIGREVRTVFFLLTHNFGVLLWLSTLFKPIPFRQKVLLN